MVSTVGDLAGNGGRLILMSTSAMSRQRALTMFSVIAAGALAAAVGSGLLGVWAALPVALLVIAVAGIVVRSAYLRTQIGEVVSIAGDTVAVEKHWPSRQMRHEFQRGWAQVVLEQPLAAMPELSRLFIRSHGRQVELGALLDEGERRELADRLRRLMGPARSFESCASG